MIDLLWSFVLTQGVEVLNAIIMLLPDKTPIVDELRVAIAASAGWQWLQFTLKLINYLVPIGPVLSFFFWRPAAEASILMFRAGSWAWRSVKW